MRHKLSVDPVIKEDSPLYVNEPWIIDQSYELIDEDDLYVKDNIRIYVPLDLNEDRILSRLRYIIGKYRVASETNEVNFSIDVGKLIYQIEIYDQIWFVREGDYKQMSTEGSQVTAEKP